MQEKMYEKSISSFLYQLKEKQPIPGGGSASSLVGALGVSLLNMDAIYTTENEKYKNVEKEILTQLSKYSVLIEDLKELIQKDVDAFFSLSKCYKMPCLTDEEKNSKKEALEENLYKAAMVPLNIMQKSYEAILLIERLREIGNKNLISDVATGAVFLEAALKGASLSVFCNTSLMKNQENKNNINNKASKLLEDGVKICQKCFVNISKNFLK